MYVYTWININIGLNVQSLVVHLHYVIRIKMFAYLSFTPFSLVSHTRPFSLFSSPSYAKPLKSSLCATFFSYLFCPTPILLSASKELIKDQQNSITNCFAFPLIP